MYNIGRPFLYYILSLSLLCLVVELIFKEIMHFRYMKDGHATAKKSPAPGDHEIYNYGRPFLGHNYYTLSLYGPCPGVEKKILKKIHKFYTFTSKLPPLIGEP